MRTLTLLCVLCVAAHLVASLPVEPLESAVQEQQPQEQQETLITLDLGDPKHELSARDKRTIGFLRQLFPGLSQQSDLNPEGENQLAGAESQQNEVRVQFTEPEQSYDQESAASGGNDAVDGETEEDQRNKRFLNFGASADASGGSSSSGSGSGGGSGNFLFDIIRLIAGSGNTESSDEGKSAEISAGGDAHAVKDDGYQAGVPGPITRLLVIANRGLANLMQDLILRLAQTSERIVNFKARLITSII